MDDFRQAMFIHLHAEVEALVSEREGMRAANAQSPESQPYNEEDFKRNANQLRCVIHDPHQFS